jgi:taurine dioxygenase
MRVRRIAETFVGEIGGVDLSQSLLPSVAKALNHAFLDHSVLVFHDQNLSKPQLVAFARCFGEPIIHVLTQYLASNVPEVMRLSNRDEAGNPVVFHNGAEAWHTDLSFTREPSMATILYGHAIPPTGGDTLFADCYAAYDGLDAATRSAIADWRAVHSFLRYQTRRFADRPLTKEQKAKTPDVSHPVVRTHPATGRKALYIGDDVVSHAEGREPAASKELLDGLLRHATQDRYVYRHRWRRGDVVMYDNRCTLHRVTEYDMDKYERTLLRASLKGDVPH